MKILNFAFSEEKYYEEIHKKLVIFIKNEQNKIKKITIYDDGEVYIVSNLDYFKEQNIDLYEIAFNDEVVKFIKKANTQSVPYNFKEDIELFEQFKKEVIKHESL